jgi:hypothetical protein
MAWQFQEANNTACRKGDSKSDSDLQQNNRSQWPRMFNVTAIQECMWAGLVQLVYLTPYELDGPGIESLQEEVSAFVQIGPGVHAASYTMGAGSFMGVKRPGRGVKHPSHLASRLKVKSYTYSFPLCLHNRL